MTRCGRAVGRVAVVLLGATWLGLAGCAERVSSPVTSPQARFVDYPYPTVPATLRAGSDVVRAHDLAWRALQAGNLRAADRGFSDILATRPRFYPAIAAFGFVTLARRDAAPALATFDRALAIDAAYVPALVGRGDALIALGRDADALAALRTALAADATLGDVRRRIEVLEFRAVEALLARAGAAEASGDLAGARVAYEHSLEVSPDSALVLRRLAAVESRLGDREAARKHAVRSSVVDPNDPEVWLLLSDLQAASGDLQTAIESARRAAALDPALDVSGRLARLESRVAASRLPDGYRAIEGLARITRGDLAALVAIRFDTAVAASARGGPTPIVTDIRGHWAAPWILAVVRAGLMEAFSNHAFQPRGQVRRGDLAVVVSRLLKRVDALDGGRERATCAGFADLGVSHAQFGAACAAVSAGVMSRLEGNSFQVARAVSGAEALETLGRLEGLARRSKPRRDRRP